jgi:nitrogen regulatory protein PII
MNNIHYKIGAGIIAAALMTASFAPAALAATTISGNGRKSDNKVVTKKAKVTLVGQQSKTKANTFVNSVANTGGNKANDNTGSGNVNIGTGATNNTATVTVTGGGNDATLSDLCGCEEDGDITITDNGRKSDNTVVKKSLNVVVVGQNSSTEANTVVNNVANTGDNRANDNTGDGAASVQTGTASNTTTVGVTGGSNTLSM